MALTLFNKTTGSLPVPRENPVVVLPLATAAPEIGKRGPPVNATEDLQDLTETQYRDIQKLIDAGDLEADWSTGLEEFPTPGLTVGPSVAQPEAVIDPGPDGKLGTEDDIYPVLSFIAHFEEPEFETGNHRAVPLFGESIAPYRLRILQVLCTISRGAPDAQMYLCCHPGGGHDPHSDKFDAASPGQYHETSTLEDRLIEEGDEVYAFCSNDYVLGRLTVMYQRVKQ